MSEFSHRIQQKYISRFQERTQVVSPPSLIDASGERISLGTGYFVNREVMSMGSVVEAGKPEAKLRILNLTTADGRSVVQPRDRQLIGIEGLSTEMVRPFAEAVAEDLEKNTDLREVQALIDFKDVESFVFLDVIDTVNATRMYQNQMPIPDGRVLISKLRESAHATRVVLSPGTYVLHRSKYQVIGAAYPVEIDRIRHGIARGKLPDNSRLHIPLGALTEPID